MRRVIVAAWGPKSDAYIGQQVTLYCDPNVDFGGVKVGGTRISHMSGISSTLEVPLLVKRGKSAIYKVEPLTGRDWTKDLEAAGDDINKVIALGTEARAAGNQTAINQITARYNELKAPNA